MSLTIVHFSPGYSRGRVCPRREPVYTFPMRDRGTTRCARISAHPVHTLTGRYIRRPLADSRAGIIISSALLGDRYGHEEGEGDVWGSDV